MQLTDREAQILRLLPEYPKRSIKAAARDLGISKETVKAHLRNARRANGVESTADLIFLFWHEEEDRDKAA